MGFLLKIISSPWLNLGLNFTLNLVLCAVIYLRGMQIGNLENELNLARRELNLSALELKGCETNLSAQNDAIEKMKLDALKFKRPNLAKFERIRPLNSACESELAAYKKLFEAAK